MDPRTQELESAAGSRSRWIAAIALALTIALYLGLQARTVAAAVFSALEALRG